MSWPELIDDLSRQATIKTYSQTEDYIRSRLRPFWVHHIRLIKLFRRFLCLETTRPEFKTVRGDAIIAGDWSFQVRLSVHPKWLSPIFLRASEDDTLKEIRRALSLMGKSQLHDWLNKPIWISREQWERLKKDANFPEYQNEVRSPK